MPPIALVHIFLQLRGIGEIAVVAQDNSKGRIHIEGLTLLRAHCTAGRGITHMAHTHLAQEIAHVAGTKDISNQPHSPCQMNTLALSRCNTRRILATVLHQQ